MTYKCHLIYDMSLAWVTYMEQKLHILHVTPAGPHDKEIGCFYKM